MRHRLLTFLVLAMTVGCQSSSASKVKIGFVLDNMNEERYAKDKTYFEQRAKSLGADVLFASADSNANLQLTQVENLLSAGVQALVVQPVDSLAAKTLAEISRRDGVPIIAYDRIILGAPVDLYVTQDSFEVGRLQAEAAVNSLGGRGNVIILSGAQGHSVAEAITAGAISELQKYPNIQIVAHQYHPNWSSELALKTVENTLTRMKNNVQAILANNSGMAHGAVQAVAEQNLSGKIFIAGADADLSSVKDILSGKQQFEVLKDIKPLAEMAAEAAVKLAKGESVATNERVENQSGVKIPVINTPVYAIRKNDIEKLIVESGFHSRAAVYGEEARP